jgi:hypothetical protein
MIACEDWSIIAVDLGAIFCWYANLGSRILVRGSDSSSPACVVAVVASGWVAEIAVPSATGAHPSPAWEVASERT